MSSGKRNRFRDGDAPETLVEIVEQVAERPETAVQPEKKTEKKNRSRQNKKEEVKASKVELDKPSLAQRWQQALSIYRNEKTQKILGLLMILFAAYLSIAFISYFFSWQIDQDKVLGSTRDLFSPDTKISNWLGKVGALISHWFMYKGFGAASFVLVPVLVVFGVGRLVQKPMVNAGSFNAKW